MPKNKQKKLTTDQKKKTVTTRALSKKTHAKIKKLVPVDLWVDTTGVKESYSEKETVNVTISFTLRTEFEAYEKKSVNNKVVKEIERWVDTLLKANASFIPFYVDNQECSTSRSRITVDSIHTS